MDQRKGILSDLNIGHCSRRQSNHTPHPPSRPGGRRESIRAAPERKGRGGQKAGAGGATSRQAASSGRGEATGTRGRSTANLSMAQGEISDKLVFGGISHLSAIQNPHRA